MCGFFGYIGSSIPASKLEENFERIQYRGPDNTSFKKIGQKVNLMFHRLAIIGSNADGGQPMQLPNDDNHTLICNGEIYNYKDLNKKYGFPSHTGSDCEVILHLYKKFGIKKTVMLLDGVFAFVLYDKKLDIMFSARDPFGVRPSFFGFNNGEYLIASEAKVISDLCEIVYPFPPGSWWGSDSPSSFVSYYNHRYDYDDRPNDDSYILSNIRNKLVSAVEKRLMSEREIGCLLSGGLDSSLIAALVCKMNNGFRLKDGKWTLDKSIKPSKIKTFSIGMSGSPDLKYAKIVADYIGSEHHEVLLTQEEFLLAIEEVVYKIESYDTTTVRASVGNYLVSKYIKDNTDCKVIFNGDGSDEVCCGYVYNINAPSPHALHEESLKLLRDIHFFDVLRSDRSISSNGLEPRTPFLDKDFVDFYMSISSDKKMFDKKNRIEKHLLRKAFEKDKLLPHDILWRHKCAFSDGVSDIKKSWHEIIKEFVDRKITDEEFALEGKQMIHCKPVLKESFYYRKLFLSYFPNCLNLIPYFWMPNWSNSNDPSARELSNYQE